MSEGVESVIGGVLLYFLLPLWIAAGVADYFCHRRTHIEHTSGLRESTLHVVQALEIFVPLVLGLFFEINALVLSVMVASVVLHMLTALWDGTYTYRRRPIVPFEQHVHSHLEYVPVVAVLLVCILYWNQFQALFGAGPEPPSFQLIPKKAPIPWSYTGSVLALVVLFQGSLLAEEFVRTWRHRRTAG
jgi:hypothetical protein